MLVTAVQLAVLGAVLAVLVSFVNVPALLRWSTSIDQTTWVSAAAGLGLVLGAIGLARWLAHEAQF